MHDSEPNASAREFLRHRAARQGLGILSLLGAALLLSSSLAPTLRAAAPAEQNAFRAAADAFKDSQWSTVETWLAKFLQDYPASTLRVDAVLMLAMSQFQLGKTTNVVELLTANLAQAGLRKDEFLYWIAESHFRAGDHASAAKTYAELLAGFPGSKRTLETAVGEAQARYRLGELDRVVGLLSDSNGSFQRAAKARPGEEPAWRGQLLLGQVLFDRKDFKGVEAAMAQLAGQPMKPDLKWKSAYLLARSQWAENRLADALRTSTNLVEVANASGQRPLQGEAWALQAQLLEQVGDLAGAVAACEKNTAPGVPEELRRDALLTIIRLTQTQTGKRAEALQRLQRFAADYPKDPALDLVELNWGELLLKEHYAGGDTNAVQQALGHFDRVIESFPKSPLVGKAQLDRGWSLWAMGRVAESAGAFHEAVQRLPVSEDQAVARFKLGEAQYWQKDFTNAVQNFAEVVRGYAAVPSVTNSLVEQALYQMLRASIELGDLGSASEAVNRILKEYPEGAFGDRSMLLLAQALNRVDQPAKAREVLAEFGKRFAKSPLLPEVEIAIARTFVQEANWLAAIQGLNTWATNFPAHPAAAEVEFDRAWLSDRAGLETNALALFTNFVARFPTNTLAARAQMWVGDYYFRQGDYVAAEATYQRLYRNTSWPASELTYRAQLQAGRAAFARRDVNEARKYFTTLINLLEKDTNSPPGLETESWLYLGDTIYSQFIELNADPAKALEAWGESLAAFTRITTRFATNPIAARAWGRIGDCYLQRAQMTGADPQNYESAAEAYRKAMTSLEISVRSQAEVGLGLVLEKQGKVDQALDAFKNVIYGNNLQNDTPDLKWVKTAGLEATRILEEQKQWQQAVGLYRRLQTLLPQLDEVWRKKIDAASTNLVSPVR